VASIRTAVAILCGLVSIHVAHAEQVQAVPQIVDADTVYASSTKIRLNGIDAPEMDQVCIDAAGKDWKCGIDARKKLQVFAHDRPWDCDLTGTDVYRRHLGSCTVGGEDVSRWLVRNGWALAFRRYSTAYVADEDYAREHKNGLWSGAFIAPWEWRQPPNRLTRTVSSRATLKAPGNASITCRAVTFTTGWICSKVRHAGGFVAKPKLSRRAAADPSSNGRPRLA
jgi:endonuclease YncB( thermonuclease family)